MLVYLKLGNYSNFEKILIDLIVSSEIRDRKFFIYSCNEDFGCCIY